MKKVLITTLCASILLGFLLSTHFWPLRKARLPDPSPSRAQGNAQDNAPNQPPHPSSNPVAPPTVNPPTAALPPRSAGSCHAAEYRLPARARASDWDEYLDRANAFRIEHEPVAPGSVCVKVDGRPVEFRVEGRAGKQEIVIGSVVGPESVIRVSYCTGPARCKEACGKPAKRFTDELLDSREPGPQDADSRELHEKMHELETLVQERLPAADRAMVRDWNIMNRQAWTCRKD